MRGSSRPETLGGLLLLLLASAAPRGGDARELYNDITSQYVSDMGSH